MIPCFVRRWILDIFGGKSRLLILVNCPHSPWGNCCGVVGGGGGGGVLKGLIGPIRGIAAVPLYSVWLYPLALS